jgi:hypothetical protein
MTSEFWQHFSFSCKLKNKRILVYFYMALGCDTPILESLFHTCFAYIVIRDVRQEKEAGKALFHYIHNKLPWGIPTLPGVRPYTLSNSSDRLDTKLSVQLPNQEWQLSFFHEDILTVSRPLRFLYRHLDYSIQSKVGRNLDAMLDSLIKQIVDAFK